MQQYCIGFMNKRDRQQKILGLIQASPIGTQADLRTLLESTGVPATQSSLSRDLEELGVVKQHGHYTLPRTNGAGTRGLPEFKTTRETAW
jgi:transcriptional regulator of arginine metabolism